METLQLHFKGTEYVVKYDPSKQPPTYEIYRRDDMDYVQKKISKNEHIVTGLEGKPFKTISLSYYPEMKPEIIDDKETGRFDDSEIENKLIPDILKNLKEFK